MLGSIYIAKQPNQFGVTWVTQTSWDMGKLPHMIIFAFVCLLHIHTLHEMHWLCCCNSEQLLQHCDLELSEIQKTACLVSHGVWICKEFLEEVKILIKLTCCYPGVGTHSLSLGASVRNMGTESLVWETFLTGRQPSTHQSWYRCCHQSLASIGSDFEEAALSDINSHPIIEPWACLTLW